MSYEEECKKTLDKHREKIKKLEEKYFTEEYSYLCTGNEYSEEFDKINKETDLKIKHIKRKYGIQ